MGMTGRCSRIFGRHRLSGQDGAMSLADIPQPSSSTHPVLYSTSIHKPVHIIPRDVPSLLPPCQANPYDKSSRHAPFRGTRPARPTRPISEDESNRHASILETGRDESKRSYPRDEASRDIPSDYPSRHIPFRETRRDAPAQHDTSSHSMARHPWRHIHPGRPNPGQATYLPCTPHSETGGQAASGSSRPEPVDKSMHVVASRGKTTRRAVASQCEPTDKACLLNPSDESRRVYAIQVHRRSHLRHSLANYGQTIK